MPDALESYGVNPARRMVIAGGGTGGHLFPGIAVAQAFLARNLDNQVLFVNAGRPLEVSVLNRLGWPFKTIPIEGLKGRGIWHQLKAAVKIPWAVWRSARIMRFYSPHAVLGVGGYSAGPVVLAAWIMRIPTALHEQNRLPGLTNRLLHRLVDRIYLTFDDPARRFAAHKTRVTGNPVRDEFIMLEAQARDANGFSLLILGGSQGAHAINQAMVEAAPRMARLPGLQVVHQTGREDAAYVAEAYRAAGLAASVEPFFNDMAERYRRADLIVCRAGATTVAEITVVGRAAIFVPFPFAADDHQTRNAQALVDAGAARMIRQSELNGALLADAIEACMRDRVQLNEMAARALGLGRPEAALTIVRDICELINAPMGQRTNG
ncbi:MAG: undecaprenyldiphospho-muramoylpentapeptide beta-N-acetylglucosaminyltransferase [Desulfobacteraceae bacterium]|nr:MAG: undecaprenyldiphospho-muramoylpentapeptide beta-N-acetylglucosaminyltransferase [Desulfobacteraceae bacterium]